MPVAIAPTTEAALRHLRTHGITTGAELKTAVPGLRLNSLAQSIAGNLIAQTEAGYQITRRGRQRLAGLDGPPTHSGAPTQGARPNLMGGDPYRCPELRRNAGINAERFVAFDLPSRIGQRLHYPDGRVEPMPSLRPALPDQTAWQEVAA